MGVYTCSCAYIISNSRNLSQHMNGKLHQIMLNNGDQEEYYYLSKLITNINSKFSTRSKNLNSPFLSVNQ